MGAVVCLQSINRAIDHQPGDYGSGDAWPGSVVEETDRYLNPPLLSVHISGINRRWVGGCVCVGKLDRISIPSQLGHSRTAQRKQRFHGSESLASRLRRE